MQNIDINFIADGSGDSLVFTGSGVSADFAIDNVSLKPITTQETVDNYPVKEFLTGNTDEGEPIFFRADTQQLLLSDEFENFSNPIAIATRTQRGSLMKCFVALDDGDFYELEGTVSKGVSIIKVHSNDRKGNPSPPIAREIRVSWRDSSKQICRLNQTAIVFIPGNMDSPE
jgi:hypothetical protein